MPRTGLREPDICDYERNKMRRLAIHHKRCPHKTHTFSTQLCPLPLEQTEQGRGTHTSHRAHGRRRSRLSGGALADLGRPCRSGPGGKSEKQVKKPTDRRSCHPGHDRPKAKGLSLKYRELLLRGSRNAWLGRSWSSSCLWVRCWKISLWLRQAARSVN